LVFRFWCFFFFFFLENLCYIYNCGKTTKLNIHLMLMMTGRWIEECEREGGETVEVTLEGTTTRNANVPNRSLLMMRMKVRPPTSLTLTVPKEKASPSLELDFSSPRPLFVFPTLAAASSHLKHRIPWSLISISVLFPHIACGALLFQCCVGVLFYRLFHCCYFGVRLCLLGLESCWSLCNNLSCDGVQFSLAFLGDISSLLIFSLAN